MNSPSKKAAALFLMVFLLAARGFCQNALTSGLADHRQKLAVLPFETVGLSTEEGFQLTQRFEGTVSQSKRFELIHQDTMRGTSVRGAGTRRFEQFDTPLRIAELGKVLGVEKIIHAQATRLDKHYVLHIRLVNVSDAKLLYDERADYSGEFSTLLSEAAVQQAQKLCAAKLDIGTQWYIIAANILLGVGAIYWILRSFRRKTLDA